MSIRVMARVWDHSTQEGGALLLLLALADWADDDGYSWPKLPALAEKARLSRRGAQYAIASLTAAGEIQHSDGRGRGVGTVYRVLTGLKGEAVAPFDGGKKAQSETQKGAIHDTEKAQMATRKGANGDTHIENRHEPSITTPVKGRVKDPSAAPKGAGLAQVSGPASDQPNPRRAATETIDGHSWGSVLRHVAARLGVAGDHQLVIKADPSRLQSWCGRLLAEVGRHSGSDRAKAVRLIDGWADSDSFRFRGHTRANWPDAFNAWAMEHGGVKAKPARLLAAAPPGAPDNWRDVLFAPDGSRRAPQFVLRRLGMEEHLPPAQWPAWMAEAMA